MPAARAANAQPHAQTQILSFIDRMRAREEGEAFKLIFTNADLTRIDKVKQWIKVVAYSCGKTVSRMERMTEANLCAEMNKAYYLRLQVIFADVDAGQSYWANHLGFDVSFKQMMTYSFGSGSTPPVTFFDYNDNEDLLSAQVDSLYRSWSSPHLWKKYGEIKTEMIGHMLPLLLKQRIIYNARADAYEFCSGGSFAEVAWSFIGALFQVRAVLLVMAYCLLANAHICRTKKTPSTLSVFENKWPPKRSDSRELRLPQFLKTTIMLKLLVLQLLLLLPVTMVKLFLLRLPVSDRLIAGVTIT